MEGSLPGQECAECDHEQNLSDVHTRTGLVRIVFGLVLSFVSPTVKPSTRCVLHGPSVKDFLAVHVAASAAAAERSPQTKPFPVALEGF